MKNILSGYYVSVVLFTMLFGRYLSAADYFKYNLKNDFYLQHNNISGNSASSSTLSEGSLYYDVFSLSARGNIDDFKYNLNLGIRLTNDKKKDIEKISLSNLAGKIRNKNHTLSLGDYMSSFSKYSMNSALKGVSYTYDNKVDKVNLIYGSAYARWDSFWKNETKTTNRDVMGLRYSRKLSNYLILSTDLVKTEDGNDELISIPLYSTMLYTVNSTYKPIKGLKIYGEYSFSQNTTNSSNVITKNEGSAIFLQATANKNPSRVRLEYEIVSPKYKTVTGSATADREKAKATWRYKYTKTATINSAILWFRNNLDGEKSFTTNTYRPSVGVTLKHLMDRHYGVLDLNYKLNIIDTPVNKTFDMIYNLNYKDKFGMFHSNTNLNYNIYDTSNDVRSQQEFKFNTTLNSRHSLSGFILKPSLVLGTWNMNDNLSNNGNNEYYQAAAGLGLDIPKKKITSTLRVGKNRSTRDVGANLDKLFGSFDLYWKVGKVEQFKNVLVYFKSYINDYDYTVVAKNYRETSVTLGSKMSF